jgi:hypothetical protein
MPGRPDLAELTPCIARLYLYTEKAAGFYGRLGWQRELETRYEGERVTVMRLDVLR